MYVNIESGEKSWRDVYKLCIGFINPRPIALVSTISPAGVLNVAPFSFYNMVSGNPPVVLFCPTVRRTGGDKDTLQNVKDTGEFAIATVSAKIAEAMNRCAAELPPDQSEFEYAGLTPRPAKLIKPPLVAESPVNIECRLRQIITTGNEAGGGNVVFGDIVALHVADDILDADGLIDPRRLTTVGRLGGSWYANADDTYEMMIPPPPGT